MNIKITDSQHNRLKESNAIIRTYLFGSHLFGITNEHSDLDILNVYDESKVFTKEDLSTNKGLNNIHAFQHDDVENKIQTIWMTEEQYIKGIKSGDGIINLDCFIFVDNSKLEEIKTYKIIKAYIGIAKRDLKQSNKNNNQKKIFHANKSLYIAESILSDILPTIQGVRDCLTNGLTREDLNNKETELRLKINQMLDDGELQHYYINTIQDELLMVMLNANNIKEFKY